MPALLDPPAATELSSLLTALTSLRAGRFGVVVGVDRVGQADELLKHGADVVVSDLSELLERE